MITVKLEYKGKNAVIEIKGHAGYAESGNDIVCAAVSTACILSANLVEKLSSKDKLLDVVCDDGYFLLNVSSTDFTTKTIFENLVDTLDELQKQYPKYIKYKN